MSNLIQASVIRPAQIDTETGPLNPASSAGFADTLKDAIAQVEQLHTEASAKVADLLRGNGEDVHSALIAVEKADLSFQLMMQVRNKIVQAYQEISRMNF